LSSAFVSQYADTIARQAPGPIADIACGYGRHAIHLAKLGCQVYCLDNNAQALSMLNEVSAGNGKLLPVDVDLAADDWPFKANELGGIINVHYFHPELITSVADER
jgi:SAM-dependent methyltransferase